MGRTNRHHTPYWSVVVYLGIAGAVVVAAGGRDQALVLFYAVAVFVSFLAGLLSMARFARRAHDLRATAINVFGARHRALHDRGEPAPGFPVASLAASLLIGGTSCRLWVRQGKPRSIAQVEQDAELT